MKSMKSIGRSGIGLKNRLCSSALSKQAQIIRQQRYRNLPGCQLWNCTDSTVPWNPNSFVCYSVSPSLHCVRSPSTLLFGFVLIICIRYQRKSYDKIELSNFDFLIPKLNAKSFVYNSFGHFLQTLQPNAHKTAQKTKNIFLEPVLNFIGTYFWSRTFHFVKLL